MRRKLLTFCSAVSLLLCVAVCVLWLRSYWVADTLYAVDWQQGEDVETIRNFGSRGGGLYYHRHTESFPPHRDRDYSAQRGWSRSHALPYPGVIGASQSPRWSFWGFAAYRGQQTLVIQREFLTAERTRYLSRVTEFGWVAPYWFALLVTSLLPASLLWVRLRRRHRLSRGCCGACGYDLRASPGRCPECGRVPDDPPPHNPPMHRTGPAV